MTDPGTQSTPRRRTAPPRRQWGTAGVLLTTREVRLLEARAAQRRREAAETEKAAYAAWERGHVIPRRITTALNLRRLEGPEVDEACGVEEPAVDMWEEGTLYPTWEQLLALAELTGFPVAYFTKPIRPADMLRAVDTSLRFHLRLEPEPEPVLRFTPKAIAATLHGYCVTCHSPSTRAAPAPMAAPRFEQTLIPLP